MPKLIEFVQDWFAEVESTAGRMQQVPFRRGAKLLAVVRLTGDTKTANLELSDGRTARRVPLAHFTAADELARAA